MRKKGITAIKVIISAVLIYFIFTKINFEDVVVVLKRTNPIVMKTPRPIESTPILIAKIFFINFPYYVYTN